MIKLSWLKEFWQLPEGKQILSGCMLIISVLASVLIYKDKKESDAQKDASELRDKMAVMERVHGQETANLLRICDSQKTAIRIEEKADLKQQIKDDREYMKATVQEQQLIISKLRKERR